MTGTPAPTETELRDAVIRKHVRQERWKEWTCAPKPAAKIELREKGNYDVL